MSKFKKLGLDDLRQYGINVSNPMIVNSIDKFIEDSTIHLLSLASENEGYQLDIDFELNRDYDPELGYYSKHCYDDYQLCLSPGSDIFLSIDFEIYGNYERDGSFDYSEVNLTKITLNWMNNSFSMIGTEVEIELKEIIKEWI